MADHFPNSRAALKVFDDKRFMRNKAWLGINSPKDIALAEKLDEEHANEVREAYYEDTRDFNSRDNCMRLHVYEISRIIRESL